MNAYAQGGACGRPVRPTSQRLRIALSGLVVALLASCLPLPTAQDPDQEEPRIALVDPQAPLGATPVPGDSGALTLEVVDDPVAGPQMVLRFSAATDPDGADDAVRYLVITSSRDDVATAADLFVAFGGVVEYADVSAYPDGEFARDGIYREPRWLNVAAIDEAGNVAAYSGARWEPDERRANTAVIGEWAGSAGVVTVEDGTPMDGDDPAAYDYLLVVTHAAEEAAQSPANLFRPADGGGDADDDTAGGGAGAVFTTLQVADPAPRPATAARVVPRRGFPGQHDGAAVVIGPPVVPSPEASRVVPRTAPHSIETERTFITATDWTRPATEISARRVRVVESDGWTVRFWLADGSGASPEQVAAVASRFVDPVSDDPFDVTRRVFGEPWGDGMGAAWIGGDVRAIDILVYDIDGDGPPVAGDVRTVGYFWWKDNARRTTASGGSNTVSITDISNEALMFAIDAPLLADADGATWEVTDSWPQEIVATLVHELQHMIHFYQRAIATYPSGDVTLSGASGSARPIWINEMMSQAAEEIAAEKGRFRGPRGVAGDRMDAGPAGNGAGRPADFNGVPLHPVWGPDVATRVWGDGDLALADYASAHAFGAFLLRRYGPDLFTALATSTAGEQSNDPFGTSAIEDAVASVPSGDGPPPTFAELLSDWAVAVALSDDPGAPAPLQLNRGGDEGFAWTIDGQPLRVGSINYHNYWAWTGPETHGPGIPAIAPESAAPVAVPAGGAAYFVIARETLDGTLDLTWVPETGRARLIRRAR